ncbi:FlgD immunoglobulin-like domain containing protein [Candidatus Poribacteria bacterium]
MRYIVATFALCMLVVSAYAGTYVENFDDGNFDGWEIFEGGEPGSEWTVEDGVLTGRREILFVSDLLFGEEDWRNYTIECDAKMIEPLGEELCLMGFDYRIVDTDIVDGQLNNDDVSPVAGFLMQQALISVWIDNEFSGESEHKDIDFELNRWYRFKAVAHEDTFEFYIDGVLVASLIDDRFPTGRLGLFIAACEAQFDNVIITGDDVPDNTDSLVDGDLVPAMYWFEESWRVHNADLSYSIFTDDAVFDNVPFPLMTKGEENRQMVEGWYEAYPTIYVLDECFRMTSAENGVGFMEHTDVYVYPDNGAPIEEFHICLMDFDGPKAKRLTVYSDWGTSMIQAGIMPPHSLSDMIPSFPLPAPEPTGLDPMEASAELIDRLNSHDLASVAKMLRSDVDVWFPFIGRPANRREFIDIHEQMLGGFSDASWENVRRVDMGDGWLFSEVKLSGTNAGEFLDKPATGLPMEIRTGWIEHYDENGLATYVHMHFDTLSVPGQDTPPEQPEDFSNVFFMELTAGLNMLSLPLKPQTPYTARSLAEEIGATVVIQYDEALGRFVGFTPASSGDGFPIEGGKGYIVNVLEGKTFACTGATWTNEPSAEAAPSLGDTQSGWAFIVSGAMTDHQESDYTVTVRNLRTDAVATDAIKSGRFDAVFADLNRNAVIEAGDKVEIIIRDSSNSIVAGPVTHQIGQDDIRKAFRDMVIPYGYARPEKCVLLQNYPNPFNPETWIPFHLAEEADVSVRIYDTNGRLVRILALGHKSEGIYVDKSKAIYWDGRNEAGETVASGIYYYSITAGDFSATRKMIVKK